MRDIYTPNPRRNEVARIYRTLRNDWNTKLQAIVRYGAGQCADCSCPSYFGSSYTCSRGGCQHHYDRHW